MQQQWSRPIILILGLATLLIPGIRRGIFFRMLKNRTIRNLGLKLIVSTPFVRERLFNKILPTRQPQ